MSTSHRALYLFLQDYTNIDGFVILEYDDKDYLMTSVFERVDGQFIFQDSMTSDASLPVAAKYCDELKIWRASYE